MRLFHRTKKQLTIGFTDFTNWENVTCVNANIYMIVLIIGSIASALFIIKGCLRGNMKSDFITELNTFSVIYSKNDFGG